FPGPWFFRFSFHGQTAIGIKHFPPCERRRPSRPGRLHGPSPRLGGSFRNGTNRKTPEPGLPVFPTAPPPRIVSRPPRLPGCFAGRVRRPRERGSRPAP